MPPASPSIDHLEATWASIFELCHDLDEADWKRPTGCPGWTVQDQLAHLIDYEANALGRPRPELDAGAPTAWEHVRNPLGESNEVGIEARRGRSGSEVLEELREVTAARAEQLHGLTEADLAREITTPAGPGTLADMLTLRVMDTWSHEQDIRRALGRPGHADGPAATETVRYLARFLPVIVGKRAGAPEGSVVVVDVTGAHRVAIRVTDGRAAVVDEPDVVDAPTVTITMPPATFAALAGGRTDAPDDVTIDGDRSLGEAVVANLGFLP